MNAIRTYERGLAKRLVRGLLRIDGLKLYGIRDEDRFDWRVPTVAVRLDEKTPRQVAKFLGDRGIFVWDGNFYALNVTDDLGLEQSGGLVRIGLAHYNTDAEVDLLLEAVLTLRDQAC